MTVEFDSVEDRDAWMEHFEPVAAAAAAAGEPGTLCYKISVDSDNPKKAMIFERCVNSHSICSTYEPAAFEMA